MVGVLGASRASTGLPHRGGPWGAGCGGPLLIESLLSVLPAEQRGWEV